MPIHKTDISVYYNTTLNIKDITDHIQIPRTASITLHIYEPPHTIINLYRRPPPDPEFPKNLRKAIQTIYSLYPHTDITIQGDWNIDLLKLSTKGDLFLLLLEYNLSTTIITPTRYDNVHIRTATLIDPVLTTLSDARVISGTLNLKITDHQPTFTIFECQQKRRPQVRYTLSQDRYIRHKTAILTTATANIKSKNTSHMTTAEQLDHITDSLKTTIQAYQTKSRPRRKPWCTPKIRRFIKIQRRAYEARLENPTEFTIKRHARIRNKLRKVIKAAKAKRAEKLLRDNKDNKKAQARILSSFIPSNRSKRITPGRIKYGDKTYTDPTEIANALNEHFTTVGYKTSKRIPSSHIDTDCKTNSDAPSPPVFRLRHSTTEETVLRSRT